MRTKHPASESLLDYRTASGERAIASISTLAEFVHARAGTGYREPKTMVSFLSEVLRLKKVGEPKVREAILAFVRDSVAPADADEAESHFRSMLGRVPDDFGELDAGCARPDISALIRAVRTSSEIVAVLPSGVFGNAVGQKVLQSFAARVGLVPPQDSNAGDLRVTLWFRDEVRAKKWWFYLHDLLAEIEPARKDLEHILAMNEACDSDRIKTVVVSPIATGSKVIVAAPRSPSDQVGFSFNASRGSGVAYLSLMGAEGTREWIEDVLEPVSQAPEVRVKARSVFQTS